MVTYRCKTIVKSELKNLGLDYIHVDLGEIEIVKKLSVKKYHALKIALFKSGFELMNQKKSMFMENLIVEITNYADKLPKTNFSVYLSKKLNCDYGKLSHLFSEVKGTTIEQFIIAHKIERAKELLVYNELTLKEIALKLRYSSVAHLSNQFKKVTGLTPSFFKNMKHKRLTALENL